jgi:HSP20 family protein
MENNSFFKKLMARSVTPEVPEYKIDLARTESTDPGKLAVAPQEEVVGQLTVDIFHTPDDIFVQSAIAGAKPEDIDVNVTPDSISISGLRRQEPDPKVEYLHQECYWGKFARSIILPEEVDPENAKVNFKNGILSVQMPKTNRKKGRKLEVRMD